MTINDLFREEILPLSRGTIDLALEPTRARSVVRDYIFKSSPGISAEAGYLVLYTKIAQLLAMDRVNIDSKKIVGAKTIFPNMFSMLFLSSGSGKDRLVDSLDSEFFQPIWDDVKHRYVEWVEIQEEVIKEAAKRAYDTSKAEREKYVQAKMPGSLVLEADSGTPEAIIALRENLYDAKMAGVFFRHSEFTDFFTSKNSANIEFLNVMKKAYEGDLSAKIIKSNKNSRDTKGVPMNMLVYSSIFGLEQSRSEVLSVFSRGLARRTFVYVEENGIRDEIDTQEEVTLESLYEDMGSNFDEVKNIANRCRPYFWETYQENIRPIPELPTATGYSYKFEKEADGLIELYRRYCVSTSKNSDNIPNKEYIIAEVIHRYWKAMKLATVIAAFEHPKEKVVTKRDVQFSIMLCEIYASHYKKFILMQEGDSFDKLTDFLEQNPNTHFNKGELTKQGFVAKNEFSKWFPQALDYCQSKYLGSEYSFEHGTYEDNGYRVILYNKRPTEPDTVTISISTDNKGIYSKSFETQTVEFEKLPEILTTKQYSHLIWKDGQRHSDNFEPGFDMVVLDVDTETTLEEAVDILKAEKLSSLLITTPNHQKEKNRALTDRFRIILPLAYKFTGDINKYKACMTGLADKLGINIDRAGFDGARHFRASPKTALIEWVAGAKLDLDKYYKPQPKKASSSIVFTKPTDQNLARLYKAWSTTITKEATHGNRNNAFSKVAFWMKDEAVSKTDAESFLKQENSKLSDPLPEREIDLIVRSKW